MRIICKIWHTDSAWLKLKFFVDNKERDEKSFCILDSFYKKITSENSPVDLLRGFNIFACEVLPDKPALILTLWGLSSRESADSFIAEHRLLCQQLEEAGAKVIGFDKIEQLKKSPQQAKNLPRAQIEGKDSVAKLTSLRKPTNQGVSRMKNEKQQRGGRA